MSSKVLTDDNATELVNHASSSSPGASFVGLEKRWCASWPCYETTRAPRFHSDGIEGQGYP